VFVVEQTVGVGEGVGTGIRIGAFSIVNTILDEALAPSLSVAVTVTGKDPNSLGVPDISPLVLSSDTPAGKVPAVIANVVGALPPSVETFTESALPSTAGELVFKVEIDSAAVTGPIAFDVFDTEPPALVAVTLTSR
jgi:hypothetical protein